MLRIVYGFVSSVFLIFSSAAAVAEDGVHKAEAALQSAVDVAAAYATVRWAFTMTHTDYTEDGERTYKLRFDPRRAEGARWALLEPALEALSRDEKKTLKSMQKKARAPDEALIYDKLEVDVETVTLVSESATKASFIVPLIDEDMPEKMRDAVEMRVAVNKPGAYLETIELTSSRPFKPAPVAKINSFTQIRHYAPIEEGGPALLRLSLSEMTGKAMFKKFNSKTRTAYSDFQRVEMEEALTQ